MIVRHRTPLTAVDRRQFDRTFEQLANSFFDTRRPTGPVVDGSWRDDGYALTVDLPGVPADAVTVEVRGSALHIGATTATGDWQRSLKLGGRLDPQKVSANHVDGRLTVLIGTVDEPEARRIEIDTTPTPAAIEASADAPSDDNADASTDSDGAES